MRERIQASCTSEEIGAVRVNTVLFHTAGAEQRLWWRLSPSSLARAPDTQNHALISLLPLAMHHGADLHVQGRVDRCLLENLEELVDAWTLWRPDLFRRVVLSADEVIPAGPDTTRMDAALMYSGGADASYALVAHKTGLLGQRNRDIRAAVMVQGFDIALTDDRWFDVALRRAVPVLQSFGCSLLTVKTNWRQACVDWEMGFAFGVTSVLHQLDASYGNGLWAADEPYDLEVIPWGSNSISNPLLSGRAFPIRAVGAGMHRSAKIALIAQHAVVRDNLRVCWQQPRNGLNCGVCEKCVRTRLALSAAGYPDADAFPGSLNAKIISQIPIDNQLQYGLLQEILSIPESQLDPMLREALKRRLDTFRPAQQASSRGWIRWVDRLRQ